MQETAASAVIEDFDPDPPIARICNAGYVAWSKAA
jgi:hypothetical protein